MNQPTSLETRYRIALEAGQIGIWSWNARTGLVEFDDRGREIIGLAGADPIRLDEIAHFIHPDDRASRRSAWARALDPAGSGDFLLESRLLLPATGELRWIATQAKV